MKPIRVVPIGIVERPLLDAVAAALSAEYRVPCSVTPATIDPTNTRHPERGQYHSTELLDRLASMQLPTRALGVAAVDLYIPILTFVFGEAHLAGDCAIVSYHRLEESFYGLPRNAAITKTRLIKGAIHEIGHTYGLVHCDDYECVMAATHSVEWLDLKGSALCEECRRQMALGDTTRADATAR